MEVIAKYRYARSSAQKLRLVANLIRGLNVNKALEILKFTNKKASFMIIKVLNSAISNAYSNYGLKIKTLRVSKIYVDKASSFKRVFPRAKGRVNYITKRTSHITIFVSNSDK